MIIVSKWKQTPNIGGQMKEQRPILKKTEMPTICLTILMTKLRTKGQMKDQRPIGGQLKYKLQK